MRRKFAILFALLKQHLLGRRRNRKIHATSRKVAYIGHSFHARTRSSEFFIDYLRQFYQVEVVVDDRWRRSGDIQAPDLSFIDDSYLAVIFFQVPPTPEVLGRINHDNIVYVPMYDQCGRAGYGDWLAFSGLKIICFSTTLHRRLRRGGFDSVHVQYFPEPKAAAPGKRDEVFFWQRTGKININLLTGHLFKGQDVSIHIHRALDPGQHYVEPTAADRESFGITQSDWFETKAQLWEVVRGKAIYVASRDYEGIGLSFLEAMAMGKAVVAADHPTMNEYIEDRVTGYLFDPCNAGRLDLANLEQVQENAHRFMVRGHQRWLEERHRIKEMIERR